MQHASLPDYYEMLQVSPRADHGTIERIFRLLAKRYHPDNAETCDVERFTALLEGFRVLSDPEQRAHYDVQYEAAQRERWRVFAPEQDGEGQATDQRIQAALLSILLRARRNDADRPGVGIMDLERMLGSPEEHIRYHLWYLKERGWLARLDNGQIAITASGVDRVLEKSESHSEGLQLLKPGAHQPPPPHTAATG